MAHLRCFVAVSLLILLGVAARSSQAAPASPESELEDIPADGVCAAEIKLMCGGTEQALARQATTALNAAKKEAADSKGHTGQQEQQAQTTAQTTAQTDQQQQQQQHQQQMELQLQKQQEHQAKEEQKQTPGHRHQHRHLLDAAGGATGGAAAGAAGGAAAAAAGAAGGTQAGATAAAAAPATATTAATGQTTPTAKPKGAAATTAAATQKHVEAAALQVLQGSMKLTFPVSDWGRLAEGPRNAKCLRAAMLGHAKAASELSAPCTEAVVEFYEGWARDSSKDYQLVASCAEDIVTHCPNTPGTKLVYCLVKQKLQLKRFCAAAVNARLSSGSSMAIWDQGIVNGCAEEMKTLCPDEASSDRQLPAVAGFTSACLFDKVDAIQRQEEDKVPAADIGFSVSTSCRQAIFQRQVAESDDVRLNIVIAQNCGGELQRFCKDVLFGKAEALLCLERHMMDNEFGDGCYDAVESAQVLRGGDARLDWKLRNLCREDVSALCSNNKTYVGGLNPKLMLDDWDAPHGAGANVMPCLRRQYEFIKDRLCLKHVRAQAAKAFANPLLDQPLLGACQPNISTHCLDPRSALVCLKGLVRQGQSLAPGCIELVQERLLEAADNYDFLPEVVRACRVERSKYCNGVPSQHGAALDCLADFQEDEGFGEECREALTGQMMLAVADIRMMTSLRRGCLAAISNLCPDLPPGSARVIDCLQSKHDQIKSGTCRKQLMRLQGFAAHDYRLDYSLRKACDADVTKWCSHIIPGSGRVHACLRENEKLLAEGCRKEVHEVEAREHQEVSLNPIIKSSCETSIKTLCGKLSGSTTQLVPCLRQHMGDPAFPDDCKQVLTAALARKARKYHLQPEMKAACDADVAKQCNLPAEGADATAAAAEAGGNTTRDHDSLELVCLARILGKLSSGCRQQLALEVNQQLLTFMPGMPLTAACDADAKKQCGAGSDDISAVLQVGSLLGCLANHAEKLSPGCWSLVSLFDNEQLNRAKALATGGRERGPNTAAVGLEVTSREDRIKQGSLNVDELVSKQVQSQLKQQLSSTLAQELERYTGNMARAAQGAGFLWGVMAAALCIALAAGGLVMVRLRRRGGFGTGRGGAGTFVVKDGKV